MIEAAGAAHGRALLARPAAVVLDGERPHRFLVVLTFGDWQLHLPRVAAGSALALGANPR